MIRRLRCTFVMVSVCSVAAVLFVILGVVNWMNYRQVVGDVDRILDILAENNGSFPERGVPEEEPERDRRGAPPGISPETPYESRYFTVYFNEDEDVIRADVGRIAAVDESKAAAYAEEVNKRPGNRGFLHDYRYVKTDEGGTPMVIFLYCGRSLAQVRGFLTVSASVAAAGTGAVFLLLILFFQKSGETLCGKL